jgi:hypothetical protein
MARFAILCHDGLNGRHWDLLLEHGASLKTWALPELPKPGVELLCQALPDHRWLYLDYEGPISGGRGSVARVDRGDCQVIAAGDDRWRIDLRGQQFSGRVDLQRDSDHWRLFWTPGPTATLRQPETEE